jgi:hypothetical protein
MGEIYVQPGKMFSGLQASKRGILHAAKNIIRYKRGRSALPALQTKRAKTADR